MILLGFVLKVLGNGKPEFSELNVQNHHVTQLNVFLRMCCMLIKILWEENRM